MADTYASLAGVLGWTVFVAVLGLVLAVAIMGWVFLRVVNRWVADRKSADVSAFASNLEALDGRPINNAAAGAHGASNRVRVHDVDPEEDPVLARMRREAERRQYAEAIASDNGTAT